MDTLDRKYWISIMLTDKEYAMKYPNYKRAYTDKQLDELFD